MTSRARDRLALAAVRLVEGGATSLPSVTRVAEEAGASRRTFYRQFSSVDEALRTGMEIDGLAYALACAPERVASGIAYLEGVLSYWEGKKALLGGLTKLGLAQDCVMAWLQAAGASLHHVDPAKLEGAWAARCLADFMTGGVATVIVKRADPGGVEASARELAEVISLALKVDGR